MNVREGFVDPEELPPIEVETSKPADDDAEQSVSELSNAWPITVRLLYKPLRNMTGEEITQLTFREPTGADINRIGNPVRFNADGDTIIDDRRMMLVMANLSGVLSPILERMDPRDYNSCAYRLRSFFLPDPRAWFP